MEKYWNQAIDYDTYIRDTEEKIEHPKTDLEAEKKEFYELGLQRMNRMMKVYKPLEEDLAALKAKNFKGKILIISEAWCGDASQCIPVVDQFFKGHNEVRIFYRDGDTSLIDQFLTDGAQAIPKVLILDENYNVKNVWGPRTAYGTELLKKFKASPDTYPREEFYNDLQVYYAKNKGKDTIKEILELL